MIRVCAWHPKYFGKRFVMGQKEPLDDLRETSGIMPGL